MDVPKVVVKIKGVKVKEMALIASDVSVVLNEIQVIAPDALVSSYTILLPKTPI